MSGGYFDYKQHLITDIYEDIWEIIHNNERGYPDYIIEKFKEGANVLKKGSIYTQRIDWLLSGDDSEETFMERLTEDLKEVRDIK